MDIAGSALALVGSPFSAPAFLAITASEWKKVQFLRISRSPISFPRRPAPVSSYSLCRHGCGPIFGACPLMWLFLNWSVDARVTIRMFSTRKSYGGANLIAG